jgi:hypothetical protein
MDVVCQMTSPGHRTTEKKTYTLGATYNPEDGSGPVAISDNLVTAMVDMTKRGVPIPGMKVTVHQSKTVQKDTPK